MELFCRTLPLQQAATCMLVLETESHLLVIVDSLPAEYNKCWCLSASYLGSCNANSCFCTQQIPNGIENFLRYRCAKRDRQMQDCRAIVQAQFALKWAIKSFSITRKHYSSSSSYIKGVLHGSVNKQSSQELLDVSVFKPIKF